MRRRILFLTALGAAAAAVGLLLSRLPVDTSSAAPAQQAENKVEVSASSDLILSSTLTDVPDLSELLDAGNWKVEVCLLFVESGSGDEGQSAAFRLVVGGSAQNGAGVVRLYDGQFETVCFNWLIDLASDATVKVQARKSAGSGSSFVESVNETSRFVATEEP